MNPLCIVGLDTETTGLKPDKGDRIIEVCLHPFVVQPDGTLIDEGPWTQRINPQGKSIDAKAQAVHGISAKDLVNEQTMDHHIHGIDALLQRADILVIHNADFDIGFIAAEYGHTNMKLPDELEVVCTMQEGRFAHPKGGVPNLGLLCWALDVPYDPDAAHAADYDVDCMMKAYFNGIRAGWFDSSKFPQLANMRGNDAKRNNQPSSNVA